MKRTSFDTHLAALPSGYAWPFLALLLLGPTDLRASEPLLQLADFLPSGVSYDESIPKPADVLGFEPGEWHVRPDQLVAYAQAVATVSDRVVFEIQGRTHERRPQPLLIVTSPKNHERLETLRLAHLSISQQDDGQLTSLGSMPLVVLQGFSIHGNEPSGANSSPLLMYHLAAGQGAEIEALLDTTIILIDPSFNPDGLGRFAHWANTNRGHMVTPDPQHREYREPWPGGRTNHYLFDLNRDWLLAQHPESRNRLATFHRWRPNVLTDHHEMGTQSTFFFQPGVPIRKNPRIPANNVELTNAIAAYHAKSFDEAGRMYYTQESFDDFYPGKGSTYPDLHGSVGILFEQASSRGHAQETETGVLTFPFTVQNQFRAALSTLAGASANRVALLEHQQAFHASAREQAKRDQIQGFLVQAKGDAGRMRGFLDVLRHHRIEVHSLASATELDGNEVDINSSLVVRTDQTQYTLIRSLFERLTEFADSTFYDVSTWNLPMAFGLDYRPLNMTELTSLDLGPTPQPADAGSVPSGPGVAYALSWTDYDTAKVVARLDRSGVQTRVATRGLRAQTDRGEVELGPGTILIPRLDGNDPGPELAKALEGTSLQPYLLTTGWTSSGPDLGSNQVRPLRSIRAAIVSGRPAASYATGELWHLLDRRFEIPVSLVDFGNLGRADLTEYTHLIFPHGQYSASDDLKAKLQTFMREGGFIIGTQGATAWIDRDLRGRESDDEEEASETSEAEADRPTYSDIRAERAKQLLSGAIFEVSMDLSHPLTWGYTSKTMPVFRTSTLLQKASDNPYLDVAFYTTQPRLSGYASQENIDSVAGTVAVAAGRYGGGGWVQIVDNPTFRAVWWGPSRLVLNSLFFAHTLDFTSAPSSWN